MDGSDHRYCTATLSGRWSLVVGRWSLVVGRWSFDAQGAPTYNR